jgi:hypothetical protein
VAIVAVTASRGFLFAVSKRQTVDTRFVRLGLPLMTLGAVDRLDSKVVVRMSAGYIGMATGARVGFVDRHSESGNIHE